MTLPAFTKNELVNATKRDDLILETANQIIKDFGEFNLTINFSGETGQFYNELSKQMVVHVEELLQNNHSRFLGLLYRIDINKKEIELYEKEMKGYPYQVIITELIIHREIKKILTREYFRNNS